MDAADSRLNIRIDDLTTDHRWPLYRRDALARTPIRSVLSLALLLDEPPKGSLNVFGERTRVFGVKAVEIAAIFTIHASLAWNLVRANHQLDHNAPTSDVMGQAEGILMERYDITATQALLILKRLSDESKVPLPEVARRLVAKQEADAVSNDGASEPLPADLLAIAQTAVARKSRYQNREALRRSQSVTSKIAAADVTALSPLPSSCSSIRTPTRPDPPT